MSAHSPSLAFALRLCSPTPFRLNDHLNRAVCFPHPRNSSDPPFRNKFDIRRDMYRHRRLNCRNVLQPPDGPPKVPLTSKSPAAAQTGTVKRLSKLKNPPKRPPSRQLDIHPDDETPVTTTPPSPCSEATRLQAHQCLKSGEFRRARDLFETSVDIDPNNGRAWQDLAKLVGRKKGGLQEKANVLETSLKHNPSNPYLWQSLAVVKLQLSRLDEACRHCQQGILQDPQHTSLYVAWAAAEEKRANFRAARAIYEKAHMLAEPNAKMYHSWGHMELRLGNEGRAVQIFEKGLDCDPQNAYIWHSLGSIACSDHDFGRARECFRKALSSDEKNVVVLAEWAKLEAQEHNYDLARALFARGVAANARDVLILHSWSRFEYQTKSYCRAKELIQDAVDVCSRDSILWNQYAKIEAALGNYPKARALFKRACEVNPEDWLSWDNWSALEHKLGNTEQAAKLLQEAFRIRFNAKGAFTILANNIHDAPPG